LAAADLSGGFFRLNIRQPQTIGPAVSADLDVMAAAVIARALSVLIESEPKI